MACSCQGGGAAAAQVYEAVAGDSTPLEVSPGRTRGTLEEARAAARTRPGAWVKRIAGA